MTVRHTALIAMTALIACNGKPPLEDLGDDTRWQRGTSPCADEARPVVTTDNDGRTWVGCNTRKGLYAQESPDDDFTAIAGFENTFVKDLSVDAEGAVFAGGNNAEGDVLVQISGPLLSLETETVLDLSAIQLDLNAIGSVAVESDGDVRAMSGDGSTMAWKGSLNVWDESRDWTEEGVLTGEDGSHTMVSLESRGDATIGAGSNDSGAPTVYLPSNNDLATYHMAAVSFTTDSILTDATFSADQMAAVGQTGEGGPEMFWCAENCLSADAWSAVDVSTAADLDDDHGQLTDIDFSSDGMTGLAIGELVKRNGNKIEGYALLTTDGGITWARVSEPFPALDSCAVDDDGTFHVAGEANFYATGSIKDNA